MSLALALAPYLQVPPPGGQSAGGVVRGGVFQVSLP